MGQAAGDDRSTTGGRIAAVAAACIVFIGVRLVLFVRRGADIDELFTVWLSRKSPAAVLETLWHDSGPPLHYWLLSLLPDGADGLTAVRSISIVASLFALCLVVRHAGVAGAAVAAALLAVYPQHVYFSTMGRAYAAVAALVGLAAIACDTWARSGRRAALALACVAIVAAASSHYYGLYLVPLPIAIALVSRRELLRDAVLATAILAVALAPLVMLMTHQPQDSIAWMRIDDDALRLAMVAQSPLRLGFDGRQPMPFATDAIRIASAALLVAALLHTRRSEAALRHLTAIVVVIGGALFAAAMGFTAYFPIRFEVILSVPFILWFSSAATTARRGIRIAMVVTALAIGGLATSTLLTRDLRNDSPLHRAVQFTIDRTPADARIVATGKAYMAASALSDRDIVPYPSIHELHPSIAVKAQELTAQAMALPPRFVWVGDATGDELKAIGRTFDVRPAAVFGEMVVATCSRRSGQSAPQ